MPGAEARRRLPVGTALLSVVAIAATCDARLGGHLQDARGVLTSFEWWRPISGHLAHAGAVHLLLNLAVFVPLGVLRERRVGTRRFLAELLVLAACVAIGIRLLHDQWSTYRGLSGVVYGLLTVVLLASTLETAARGDHMPSGWGLSFGLAVFIAAKSVIEYGGGGWLVGRGWFESSLRVMYLPGSHCAGIAGGTVLVLLAAIMVRAQARRTTSARPDERGAGREPAGAPLPDVRGDAQHRRQDGKHPLPADRPDPLEVLQSASRAAG